MSGTGNVTFSDTIITPKVASHLQQYDEMTQNEDMDQVTRYGNDAITRISKLGEGCFTNVFLVNVLKKDQMALKCLDHKKIRSPHEFLGASRDLICEASLLSELEHPNIVKIHGVCMATVSEAFMGDGEGYFMLTDVMQATLKDRLALWRNDPSSYKKRGIAKRIMNKKGNNQELNLEEMKYRIDTVALGVADAMDHIHKRDIVLRNLNPSNIGFNEATGKVCLFDFGSARHLKECEHDLISGLPDYMAPEVLRAEGYSLASDVYSFSMVLFEICSLRKLTAHQVKPFVVHNGTPDSALARPNGFDSRPCLDCIPCKDTQYLIEDCWCSNPAQRPNFEQIFRAISDVVLAKQRDPSPEDRTISTHSEAD